MILRAKGVNKTFEVYKRTGFWSREVTRVQAITDFSLDITKPTIYGLVGANGAGKTTFIKHCLGLVQASSGTIEVLGYNPYERKHEFLKKIGLVSGQKQNLDPNLPALDSLMLSGYLYDMRQPYLGGRINYLSRLFKVEEKLDVPIRQLSLGQRMKFEIISSVLHEPEFLFMDEPTLGLDFEAQQTMHTLLALLHKDFGISILLTSHYMPDITTLCERVAVIDKGHKVFDGTLRELTKSQDQSGYLKTLINELNKDEQRS